MRVPYAHKASHRVRACRGLALRRLRLAAEKNEPFDLAILDLMMPDMDGFEAARAIKNDPLIKGTDRPIATRCPA